MVVVGVTETPLLQHATDEPISPATRNVMKANRGRDTKPELALRKALWAMGARYRTHPKGVPGRPDICNQRAKVAVFIDGCFWHGCPRHFKVPKTRSEFWQQKILRNQTRRAEVLDEYDEDWTVFQFYECELKDRELVVAQEIADAMASSEARP